MAQQEFFMAKLKFDRVKLEESTRKNAVMEAIKKRMSSLRVQKMATNRSLGHHRGKVTMFSDQIAET